MSRFYITGLPRSRTAWMAAWLSNGQTFCHHELCGSVLNKIAFNDAMSDKQFKAVGNSDSMLSLFPEYIDGPLVIIERDEDEVIRSLERIFGHHDRFQEMISRLSDKLSRLDGLRVKFDEVDEALYEIYLHCGLPIVGFNEVSSRHFAQFNIQHIKTKFENDELALNVEAALWR